MDFQSFIREAGLKVLAVAHLDQCQYSIVMYLLNCAVSGLDQFVTNDGELASLIGYDEETVRKSLVALADRNIINLYYGDKTEVPSDNQSLRIGMQFDIRSWDMVFNEGKGTSHDAIVFPFRRHGAANLKVFDGEKSPKHDKSGGPTWKRVLDSFTLGRTMNPREEDRAAEEAKILVETHPVDQVLLMLRHFGGRIPTLSLLASSWQHYQELFEEETQKVDLLGARQKHIELDEKVRAQARILYENPDSSLTEEERTVLQIMMRHRHPRRQLFWAYQTRSRYPRLAGFFDEFASLMLPVTSTGGVIKKPFQD